MMVLLCILDGFGLRDPLPDNAIAAAHTPNLDRLASTCLKTALDGSGPAVGLPDGQMGNSEVGHLNLGAGRVVNQDITRIDHAINSGDFFANPAFAAAMERVVSENRALHLCGLISDGKVHSSLDHLYALVKMAKEKGVKELYLHAFMDGRDTLPTAGRRYMIEVVAKFDSIGLGKVATISGRYYGMDRDRRWERMAKSYQANVHGEGQRYSDPLAAIEASYSNGVTDEFIVPVVIDHGESVNSQIKDGDAVIMFNFRADRMRQMCYWLSGHDVGEQTKTDHPQVELVTMTNYDVTLTQARVAFEKIRLHDLLGGVLARNNMLQLRTAETEKYAHVTFFFNGGVEEPFVGEDRDLIPSPKVATYDLLPEMSSVEVTKNAVAKIDSGKYSFVLLNYANCDMVGHTGDFEAARKAVEAVDRGVGQLLDAVTRQGGVAIVTADHGNAEMMIDPAAGGPWTAHTTNLVPCYLCDPAGTLGNNAQLREQGILADIAPTVLEILGLEIPEAMTGNSLLRRG